MKLIGLLVCRNEVWCLPVSLRAAMQWLDEIVILDHASDDANRTQLLLSEAKIVWPGRVKTLRQLDENWNEAFYRQALLEKGRAIGGTHFAIVDSDEIASIKAVFALRHALAEYLAPGQLYRLPWLQLWRSTDCYRADDSPFGQPRVPFIFADAPGLSFQPSGPDNYQLHKRFPAQCQCSNIWERDSGYGVLHLQYVVWRRVLAKQIHYQMDEIIRYGKVHANYAGAVNEVGLITKPLPPDWWPVDPAGLDLKAVPWQVDGIKRLLTEYGRERFKGITLYNRIEEVL